MVTRKQGTGEGETGEGGTGTQTSGFTEEQRSELASMIADASKAKAEGDKPVKVVKDADDDGAGGKVMTAREIERLQEEATRKAVKLIQDAAKQEKLEETVEDLKNKEPGKPKQVSALYRFLFGDPPA